MLFVTLPSLLNNEDTNFTHNENTNYFHLLRNSKIPLIVIASQLLINYSEVLNRWMQSIGYGINLCKCKFKQLKAFTTVSFNYPSIRLLDVP